MAKGLKITQRGTDVSRAADYQTILDSRWPLLEIWLEKLIDVTFTPTGIQGYDTHLLFKHQLGSLPGFEFYQDTSAIDPAWTGAINPGYTLTYTDDAVYAENLWITGDPTAPYRLKGRVRLYKTNFDVPFKSDTLTISPEENTSKIEEGIKIVNPSSDKPSMRSSEYSNYNLNTGAKAMSLHMEDNILPDATTHFVTVNHDLGYLPTFMAWQTYKINYNTNPDGSYTDDGAIYQSSLKGRFAISELIAFSFANSVSLSFRGVQNPLTNKVAFVVLKDPLVIAE